MSQLKVVITGGPGTGKTSIIKLLKKKYKIEPESARLVLTRNKLFKKHNAVENRGLQLQKAIWNLELKHYQKALKYKGKVVFFDRGYFDGFAYASLSNTRDKEAEMKAKEVVYDYVFLLDPLPKKLYENDKKRAETYEESKKIQTLIKKTYEKFGYKPIRVPFDTVENRTKFVLKKIKVI